MTHELFCDLDIEWEGKTYVLREDKRITALMQLEEFTTFGQLLDGHLKLAKSAKALVILLNAAGCKVSFGEVYQKYFQEGSAEMAISIQRVLQKVFLPEKTMLIEVEDEAKKKPKPKPKKATGKTKK